MLAEYLGLTLFVAAHAHMALEAMATVAYSMLTAQTPVTEVIT